MFTFKQVLILMILSVFFLFVSYQRIETKVEYPRVMANNLDKSSWETFGDYYFYFKYPNNWKEKRITDTSWLREIEFGDGNNVYLRLYFFDNSLSTYLGSDDFINKNYLGKEKDIYLEGYLASKISVTNENNNKSENVIVMTPDKKMIIILSHPVNEQKLTYPTFDKILSTFRIIDPYGG